MIEEGKKKIYWIDKIMPTTYIEFVILIRCEKKYYIEVIGIVGHDSE